MINNNDLFNFRVILCKIASGMSGIYKTRFDKKLIRGLKIDSYRFRS